MSSPATDIVIATSESKKPENISSIPCAICHRQFSRYTCPTCNAPYCSLTCFRSPNHGECSEAFYRKEIKSDIHSNPSKTAEERTKMMDLLKRFEEDALDESELLEADGGEDEVDLANRLQSLDMEKASYDEIWSALTSEEREQFMKLVQNPSSNITQQLLASEELQTQILEPWWERPSDEYEDSTRHEPIQVLALPVQKQKRFGEKPEIMEVPQEMIDNITSRTMSRDEAIPLLLYNICATLIVYSYITRSLSTSPLSSLRSIDPEYQEAKRFVSRLLPFLVERRSTSVFPNLSATITDLWSRFDSEKISPILLSILLHDTSRLIRPLSVTVLPAPSTESSSLTSHPSSNTILALSDLSTLFQSNKSTHHIAHKLTFYAATILSTSTMVLRLLADELEMRSEAMKSEASADDKKASVKPIIPVTKHKVVIEELT
ncbi:hypothetical protein C8Q75DRAFT_723127 [Abortiporus biennis]|nr:hypothetical protein C8Q75DRAFT_723127 [Abortiporus biennis]